MNGNLYFDTDANELRSFSAEEDYSQHLKNKEDKLRNDYETSIINELVQKEEDKMEEGKFSKGGRNTPPTVPRPSSPPVPIPRSTTPHPVTVTLPSRKVINVGDETETGYKLSINSDLKSQISLGIDFAFSEKDTTVIIAVTKDKNNNLNIENIAKEYKDFFDAVGTLDFSKGPVSEIIKSQNKHSMEEVFKHIAEERASQEEKWGSLISRKESLAGHLLTIQSELDEAKHAWQKGAGSKHSALAKLLQAGAVCVAALEQYGFEGNPK